MSKFDKSPVDNTARPASFGARAGRVALVGAGPGDPELLTVKGYLALKAADVVFFDDLVSPEILEILPAGARCIYVGKPYQSAGISQADIITQLIAAARGGHRVVRLKGGDPMVFGRSGEELEGLRAAGIQVDVIPGITAATGAAASTGITLTHRDYAAQVSFITAARKDGSLAEMTGLAGAGKTLVVYMGIVRAAALSAALQADGVAPAWPIAIVENATRANERVIVTTVAGLADAVVRDVVRSPALFIVGEVVKTYAPPARQSVAPEARYSEEAHHG